MPQDPQVMARATAIAREVRNHGKESPRMEELRRDLAAEKIASFAQREAAKAPPLTDEQIERIAAILKGGR